MLLLGGKIAFGIAEIIHRIQQRRLTRAIRAGDAGNGLRKMEGALRVITELGEGYLGERGHRGAKNGKDYYVTGCITFPSPKLLPLSPL